MKGMDNFYCQAILAGYISMITIMACQGQGVPGKKEKVSFKKHVVSSEFVSEGVATGDVNKDGSIDILAGHYWYEAPQWKRHQLHTDTLNPVPGYSTSFINFCMDVNDDGWTDLVRFDQPGGVCVWYENPATVNNTWKKYIILPSAGIESPAFVDVDGDGRKDLVCNDPVAKQILWLKSPSGKGDTNWVRFVISSDSLRGTHRYTHGLGWGDVN